MDSFHRRYDLLLTPTLPLPAFEVGHDTPADGSYGDDWTAWTPFTYPFNITQQPAASVPCGITQTGLPAGLQIVGPHGADALVLRAARPSNPRCPLQGSKRRAAQRQSSRRCPEKGQVFRCRKPRLAV